MKSGICRSELLGIFEDYGFRCVDASPVSIKFAPDVPAFAPYSYVLSLQDEEIKNCMDEGVFLEDPGVAEKIDIRSGAYSRKFGQDERLAVSWLSRWFFALEVKEQLRLVLEASKEFKENTIKNAEIKNGSVSASLKKFLNI